MSRYKEATTVRFSHGPLVFLVLYATIATIFYQPSTVRAAATSYGESCALNVNKDLPDRNEPLFLQKKKNTVTLVLPEVKSRQGVIELAKNEELILACPGKNNKLVEVGKTTVVTSCVRDTELNAGKTSIQSNDARCENPVRADVKPLSKKCGADGSQYEIGFEAEGWHPLISACHNVENSFTYYTVHTIPGKALRGAEDESRRPSFEVGENRELFDPSDYYKKNYQEKYFENLFGKKSSQYINKKMFLSRGHLAPDGDFLFGTWQFATYFYINMAPQWQSINAGNWLKVEGMIRRMARWVKRDITVYTGTYGVLKLDDDRGQHHTLYLAKSKLPIPELFWKVVHDPLTDRGIVFVTSNNPYLKSEKDVKSLCSDISCSKYKWQNGNLSDTEKGVTYCCDVDDFRKSVSYLPKFRVTDILTDSG